MNHIFRSTAFMVLGMIVLSCGGKSDAAADQSAQPALTDPATAEAPGQSYPSLPVATMQALYDSVDYIDFVFYYANFSMNQSNDASIKATLAHISSEVPTVYPSCQPIGSMFFQSNGRELMQAELYFSEKCVYYIWLENGQRKYANKMTPAGFQFYQQVFSQGQNAN